jgi:hypothetical protein
MEWQDLFQQVLLEAAWQCSNCHLHYQRRQMIFCRDLLLSFIGAEIVLNIWHL